MQHKISAVLLFLLVPAAMIACILLPKPTDGAAVYADIAGSADAVFSCL